MTNTTGPAPFRPALVIFDCDGVLVDTESAANRLLADALAREGFDVSYEDCRRLFVGRTLESVQAYVEQILGRSLSRDWPDRLRDETIRQFSAGVDPVPGVERLLRHLQRRTVPYCVASSGRIEKMRASLGAANLLSYVEPVLFSAEMVGVGKPAPDLFLYAARRMGAPPEDCAVIEDSVPGVEAGVRAGMRVIGYAGDPMTDGAALAAAGACLVQTMDDVGALLGLH